MIKREISIMKIVGHPNIVRLHEVLANRTKIYIILEFITGGELFDNIVHQGKLSENEAQWYFHQLLEAVDYCHRKGVYHRDLKPENLLVNSQGNLKISDFGLSALPRECGCCTPHVELQIMLLLSPEVLSHQGYDGSAADVWSCGVILYVLMAGYLPFNETDLPTLYRKINAAEFSCPHWFSPGARSLICKILDPNAKTRIGIEGIKCDAWFKKNNVTIRHGEEEEVNLDDVRAVFDDIEDYVRRQTRFVSRRLAKIITLTIEAVAESLGLKVHSRNYKIRLEGISAINTGQFAVVLEIFEVAPSLFMVDVRKATGDTLEYHKLNQFYKNFCSKLEHIIWKPKGMTKASLLGAMSC